MDVNVSPAWTVYLVSHVTRRGAAWTDWGSMLTANAAISMMDIMAISCRLLVTCFMSLPPVYAIETLNM
jgi:hypothetical protein